MNPRASDIFHPGDCMVAVGNCLYVTLGILAVVSAWSGCSRPDPWQQEPDVSRMEDGRVDQISHDGTSSYDKAADIGADVDLSHDGHPEMKGTWDTISDLQLDSNTPADLGTDLPDSDAAKLSEICDGKDNDGNGKVDDNLAPPLCAKQKGVCAGSKKSCGGAKGWEPCSADNYGPWYQFPTEDMCDTKDNDCDGQVDENITMPCSSACGKGTQKCTSGQWGSCNAPQPTNEICDGKDNDCDGMVDMTIIAGSPAGVCTCTPKPYPPSTVPKANSSTNPYYAHQANCTKKSGYPTCCVTSDTLRMDLDLSLQWSACEFAFKINLADFDDGKGALVVNFCLNNAPLNGRLRLYYGIDPNRKYLSLVDGDPTANACASTASPGTCYRCHFAPDDVRRSLSWKNGSFDSKNTQLALVSENASGSQTATVESLTVKYYPEDCKCLDESACAVNPKLNTCIWKKHLPPPPGKTCAGSARCAGLCGLNCRSQIGKACTIKVGSKICKGSWICDSSENPICSVISC